jgi:4-hydroxybenzoate polyprenyltransferase
MFTRIRQLLEMIRFSHTLFALPFALLAALMAWRVGGLQMWKWALVTEQSIKDARPAPEGATIDGEIKRLNLTTKDAVLHFQSGANDSFSWRQLIGILCCMVAGRSAAMSFNRLADRDIDARNPRTAGRHLPAGILSVGSVRTFALVCSLLFIAANAIFLPNWLPLALSVPVLLFLLGYSYTKRFTSLAHFWLGAALGLAPISSWIAIRGEIVLVNPRDLFPVLVLGGAVMLWVAGFDMIYACQDAEFDKQNHLHSIPARFGVKTALDLAATCHLGMVLLLAALPLVYPVFGILWWAGTVAIAGLLLYEHMIVKPNDLARVNTAFFNVNAVVSIGLLIIGAFDLWL